MTALQLCVGALVIVPPFLRDIYMVEHTGQCEWLILKSLPFSIWVMSRV